MGDDQVRQLLVHPAVWPALVIWLRSRGLGVDQIPNDELPTYVTTVLTETLLEADRAG